MVKSVVRRSPAELENLVQVYEKEMSVQRDQLKQLIKSFSAIELNKRRKEFVFLEKYIPEIEKYIASEENADDELLNRESEVSDLNYGELFDKY